MSAAPAFLEVDGLEVRYGGLVALARTSTSGCPAG